MKLRHLKKTAFANWYNFPRRRGRLWNPTYPCIQTKHLWIKIRWKPLFCRRKIGRRFFRQLSVDSSSSPSVKSAVLFWMLFLAKIDRLHFVQPRVFDGSSCFLKFSCVFLGFDLRRDFSLNELISPARCPSILEGCPSPLHGRRRFCCDTGEMKLSFGLRDFLSK